MIWYRNLPARVLTCISVLRHLEMITAYISVMMMKLQSPEAKWVITRSNISFYVTSAAPSLPTTIESVDKEIVLYFMLIYRINALRVVLSSPTGLGFDETPALYAPWLCFLLKNVQNPVCVTMANTDIISISVSQLMGLLSTVPDTAGGSFLDSLSKSYTEMKARLSQLADWSQKRDIIRAAVEGGTKLTFDQVKDHGLSELLDSDKNGTPHDSNTYSKDADDILLEATNMFTVEFEIFEECKAEYIGLCHRVSNGDASITYTSLLAVANKCVHPISSQYLLVDFGELDCVSLSTATQSPPQ